MVQQGVSGRVDTEVRPDEPAQEPPADSSGPTDGPTNDLTDGPTDGPPSAGIKTQLEARIDDLADAIDMLTARLAAEHERAAARERVIDRLHDENQRLRSGERQLLLRPVLTDLQRLRNELLRQRGGDLAADRATALFESFAFTIEQALERQGVLPVRPDDGERFDAGRHRAVEIVPTDDPGLDGTVARTIEEGYHDQVADRPVRPASVAVRRLEGRREGRPEGRLEGRPEAGRATP